MVVFVLTLLTFGPLYRADYAITDDYAYLVTGTETGLTYLADGRPIYYLAQRWVHSQIGSLYKLAYLRFTGVVFLACLAVLFYRLAKHLRGSKLERGAFAIALVTLPCLYDPIAMALLWLTPIASICACFAAVQTRQIVCRSITEPRCAWKLFQPLGWMLIAGMIYQPMLAFYWTVTLLFVLDPRWFRSSNYRKSIVYVLLLGFLYFICCFVAMKICFLISGVPPKNRTELLRDPIEKIYWFLRIQLPMALNYWQLMVSGSRWLPLGTAAFTGSVMFMGYWRFRTRLCKSPGDESAATTRLWTPMTSFSLLVIGLTVLSHVHWLVIQDSPQSYRITAPLAASVWALMYWAIRQLTAELTSPRRATIRCACLSVIAIAAIFTCQKNVEQLFVNSNSLSHRYLLYCLRDGLTSQHRKIHVIVQGREDGVVENYYIESFGRPPSEAHWIIEDWVRTALRETGSPQAINSITYSESPDEIPKDAETLVIDLRKIKLLRMTPD